jgi:hypothetical protein
LVGGQLDGGTGSEQYRDTRPQDQWDSTEPFLGLGVVIGAQAFKASQLSIIQLHIAFETCKIRFGIPWDRLPFFKPGHVRAALALLPLRLVRSGIDVHQGIAAMHDLSFDVVNRCDLPVGLAVEVYRS